MIAFPKTMFSSDGATGTNPPRRADQAAAVFFGLWLLAMIAVPITRWTVGDSMIPFMASLTVILQFLAVFSLAVLGWGIRRAAMAVALVAVVTFMAEYIGSTTGFPFGSYRYTASLQPQLNGVPVVIPLAWFMMLVPAWAVASILSSQPIFRPVRYFMFVIFSAAAIAAWDLFLDPQMVGWGFWEWQAVQAGQAGHAGYDYFGIPWTNYAGWFLTGILATLVIPPAWHSQLPKNPLHGVYIVVWMLQTIGLAFFWGQPAPALFGFLGMGVFSLVTLLIIRHEQKNQPISAGETT